MHQEFITYAIQSITRNYIYVGMTNDVERRLKEHNSGKNRSTKAYRPFELFYTKSFETRMEARLHEKMLKS
jgi:putative endonuclease